MVPVSPSGTNMLPPQKDRALQSYEISVRRQTKSTDYLFFHKKKAFSFLDMKGIS